MPLMKSIDSFSEHNFTEDLLQGEENTDSSINQFVINSVNELTNPQSSNQFSSKSLKGFDY